MKKRLLFFFVGLVCSLVAMGAVNTTLIDGITLPSIPTTTYTLGNVVWSGSGSDVIYLVKQDSNGNGIMQAAAAFYSTTDADRKWANGADGTKDGSASHTGTTWDVSGIFLGSAAYTTAGNDTYVNFARRGNLRTTRTFAYRFTGCAGFSALVKSNGNTDAGAACLAVYELGTNNSQTFVGTASSKAKALDVITVEGLKTEKTYVAYIYGANDSNGELYEIAFLGAPVPEHSVTYNLNGGSGTVPTQADVKEGSMFTVASAEGLTAPDGLVFKCWSDGTKTYSAGATYTMGKNDVTLTAKWSKNATLIKAVLNGGTNDPTVSGDYAGSAVAKTQASADGTVGGYKFDAGCYVGLTLADGSTFKKGDVLHVNVTKKNSGGSKLALYSANNDDALICVTDIYQEVGDLTFELTEDFNGLSTFYLYRSATYGWNAYVASVSVERPVDAEIAAINAQGYGTFSASQNMQITGAKVYKAKLNADGDMLECAQIESGKIPAGEGVLLYKKNTTEATKVIALFVESADAIEGNALKATTKADGSLASKESSLVLSGDTFKNYTGTSFVAGKAYLPYSNPAKSLSIVFDVDNATSINTVKSIEKESTLKMFKNGKLMIIKGGKAYNIAGIEEK